MYNEIVIARLKTCLEHIQAIETYLGSSENSNDFFKANNGANYDASLMRLQALGERLKSISQKHPIVLEELNYSEINNVIRFRDYVAHHYEQLEHEIVFDVCRYKISELKICIQRLLMRRVK